MATNLVRAGFNLFVYDIDKIRAESMRDLSVQVCDTIQEVCQHADVVITMLPDSPDVEAVYEGVDGILDRIKPGTFLIDMSTIAPITAIKIAEHAHQKDCPMLDAPVSGGDVGAQKGTLSIMVGGKQEVLNELASVFSPLGKPILCGQNGAGQIVKACNQILVAVTLVGMSEALVLGSKAGVDPSIIVSVLSGGLARCGVLENRGLRVIERDFKPGFKSKLHYKDLNIIQQTARDYQTALPASALAHELFASMIAKGRGDLDHSGIITIIEDFIGFEVKRK